jgi:PIN domain nuclease of toxin-antitoxin system
MSVVFDTSALICLIKEEKGSGKVQQYLEDEVFMSAINLAEFFSWFCLNGNDVAKAQEFILETQIKIIDFDSSEALESGKLITQTKKYGLSLGDRACLNLSKKLGKKVVTADMIWLKLADKFEVELVR